MFVTNLNSPFYYLNYKHSKLYEFTSALNETKRLETSKINQIL